VFGHCWEDFTQKLIWEAVSNVPQSGALALGLCGKLFFDLLEADFDIN